MRKSTKKSTQKFYAVLLTLAMVGSLAACGSVEPLYATALPGLGKGSSGAMAPPAPTNPPAPTDVPDDPTEPPVPTDTPDDPTESPAPTESPKPGEEDKSALYVAMNGSDANDGTMDRPFATISKAIETARSMEETVVINLRGGKYQATGAIELTEADSNLVIRSYPGETAEITGGVTIPFTAFSQVLDNNILDRIDSVPNGLRDDGITTWYKGMDGYNQYINVLQADLKALGITDYGVVYDKGSEIYTSLTYEDSMLELAGYPNDGYLLVDNIEKNGNSKKGTPTIFTVEGLDERYQSWTEAKDVWVTGFTNSSYRTSTIAATIGADGKISAPGGEQVKKSADMGAKGIRFMNLLEELDAEGEWYLNRETGYLYIIPPKDFGKGDELVFNNYKADFLHITGAQNIRLEGLRFADTLAQAIVVRNCDNVVVDACEFTNLGERALGIYTSTNCGIQNSSIHDLPGMAIQMVSCGNRKTLTSSGCFITNNLIELACQKKIDKYCVDINDCVGVLVNHNEIHDVPVWGIIYNDCNNMTIEYNELYKICHSGGDCGAIYCGRNWTTRGNVVRYNYIHDNIGTETYGVYLDDLHSSTEVYGNVFQKVQYACRIGGGRDNKFLNNLIVDCMFAVLANGDNMNNPWCQEGKDGEDDGYLMQRLKEMPYTEGVWAEQYPDLVNILNDEPARPKGNIIMNNAQYLLGGRIQEYGGMLSDLRGMDGEFIEYTKFENNITLSDTSSFANYALNDLTVLENSEIRQRLPQFEIIPFKEIGRQDYVLEDNYSKNSEESGVKQALKALMMPLN